MVKTTLELTRKLKRGGDTHSVRQVKRQILVKLNKRESGGGGCRDPDFVLGCYQIKGGSNYVLGFRVDLPAECRLWVTAWDVEPKLGLINQVCTEGKDVKLRFTTYPKSKWICFTFWLEYRGMDERRALQYSIPYLNIESKVSLVRGVVGPEIPKFARREGNDGGSGIGGEGRGDETMPGEVEIECQPGTLGEIELRDDLVIRMMGGGEEGGGGGGIPFRVFGGRLMNWFLKKETASGYREALVKNIRHCGVPVDRSHRWVECPVEVDDLLRKRTDIVEMYADLEKRIVIVEGLLEHKHSIENMLEDPNDKIRGKKGAYEIRVDFLKACRDSLNVKKNWIKGLQKKLGETGEEGMTLADQQNLLEILNYYEHRVLEDMRVINEDLEGELCELQNYHREILAPAENRLSEQQNSLDNILKNYRKQSEICRELKGKLDKMIAAFVLDWYFWLRKLCSAST